MNRKALKDEAKAALQGNWKNAVLLNLIPTLIAIILFVFVFFISLFLIGAMSHTVSMSDGYYDVSYSSNANGSGGGGIASGLISTLFSVGISWTFLDLLRNRDKEIVPFSDATRGFRNSNLWPVVALYFIQAFFVFLWTLLFIIPGIIKSYAYSQTYFVYYDRKAAGDETVKFTDCITQSRRLMDGHKLELFILDLSFIPWHLLGVLTFGIGYIWINPYINTTKAAFYKKLTYDQNNITYATI